VSDHACDSIIPQLSTTSCDSRKTTFINVKRKIRLTPHGEKNNKKRAKIRQKLPQHTDTYYLHQEAGSRLFGCRDGITELISRQI
jgi:hypothetical protein